MHDLAFRDSVRSQQREVTLLFADLRGFTELAASLEMIPLVCELAGHVMDCLTDAVASHSGCVVDYFGDGLLAMWNAPSKQPEHAELACGAAVEMLDTLPSVTADWLGVIQTNLRLGIGVHSGIVQVGNAGSSRQMKYGPRGPNAHLAKRVESATKELGLPLIATQATIEQLSTRFTTNRVCRARMPGLSEPLDLFAVRLSTADARLAEAWLLYEKALLDFEQGRFEDAANVLARIDPAATAIPSRFLADRVQRELGSQQRRRSSDKPVTHAGVIALTAK